MLSFKSIFYSKKRKREILELLALDETKELSFDWKNEIKISDIEEKLKSESNYTIISDDQK
ncbi:hypothetical protein X271_00349 [Candidatus Hepatoplasma crinochetorum Av]|uniref:Uncharacterized protein n=1 Tax=Candidatus Hepatoplasma crinochetorum Av TaxID=1427984 RepID=W8GSS5_9MOLU|nr:hypothetical protein [Candidatus Hepatoplasma crinochetorum]AHK22455.1 hypothetical protein X271_00349 [Candidatus Hepatoplasma crinochetorum Av]